LTKQQPLLQNINPIYKTTTIMSSFSFTSMTMTPVSSNTNSANANNNYNAYSSFLSSSSAFTRPVKPTTPVHEAPVPFSRKRTWGDESGDDTPSSSASSLLMPLDNGVSPNNNAATKRPRGPLGDITNLYRC
jgi:hypothetical protein